MNGDTCFLGFIAYDAPTIPTAGRHSFAFVISEDCKFTSIRVNSEGDDYLEDANIEGYSQGINIPSEVGEVVCNDRL